MQKQKQNKKQNKKKKKKKKKKNIWFLCMVFLIIGMRLFHAKDIDVWSD